MEVPRRYRTFAPTRQFVGECDRLGNRLLQWKCSTGFRAVVNASSPSTSRILVMASSCVAVIESREGLNVPRQGVQCPDQAHGPRKLAERLPSQMSPWRL